MHTDTHVRTIPASKGTQGTTMLGYSGNPLTTPTESQASGTAHSDVQHEGMLFKSTEHTKTRKVEIISIFF